MKYTLLATATLLCLHSHAQNIGIGETSPASKLSVKGGLSVGSGYTTTAAPTNGAIIQGNVGIGTTSPLNVFSVGASSQFQLDGSGNIAKAGSITASGTITFSALGTGLIKSNGSGVLSNAVAGTDYQTPLTSGTAISISSGQINNTGVASITSSAPLTSNTSSTGAVTINLTGTVPAANLPGSFSGLANPTASIGMTATNGSATTAMRSDAAPAINAGIVPTWTGTHTFSNSTYSALFTGGNVGIGTTAPTALLDATGTATIGIRYIKTGTTADARISLGDKSGTIWSWSCGWGAGGGGAAGDFSLIQEGISGDRIYVQAATGNVGIGTVTPAYNLDVTGTQRVTGNLTVGGAITGRVWSTNLAANVNYGSTATSLLSTMVTSHGGTLVITGKVLDQTNNNNENRNNIYLYRTTSATAYNSTGSIVLDQWTFWQATGGNPINESGLVTFSETLTAGTYYYWLVASCEVAGQTRTALTAGTRLIVYEF